MTGDSGQSGGTTPSITRPPGCARPTPRVSESGEFRGTVFIAPIKPGNLEVHWPEGMALLSGEVVDWQSGEPDYNALVRLERG